MISTQSLEEVVKVPQSLLPSGHLWENYTTVWNRIHMGRLLFNSAVVAVVVSLGKIVLAILSAFAIVFFDFRGKQVAFWMIFITLMLPVPVRIISTYQVVSTLGWVDTYAGLTIPLLASATATFLFRQFYTTIPDELVDAAKIDGAGPDALPLVDPAAELGRQHCRPLRGHVHLRMEPVPLAADGDQFGQHARRGRRHRLHRPHGDAASRMEPGHGGRDDGASPADPGGDFPPALVRPRPARNGKIAIPLPDIPPEPDGLAVAMSGGVARNGGVVRAIAELLGRPVYVPPLPDTVGALGAALIARERCRKAEASTPAAIGG